MSKKIDFIIEIGARYKDDKRDITITNRKKIKDKNGREWKYYQYKCNKCGFDSKKHWSIKDKQYKEEYWVLENSLIGSTKTGCACCCHTPRIVVAHINSIIATDIWMIPIINNIEFCKTHTHGSEDSVYPICQECGRIKTKKMKIYSIYKNHSIACSCRDGQSYPNKFAFNILEQLNIDFETEYNPEWCNFVFKNKHRKGYYDFYFQLNNKEYFLEMDGRWHTKDNTRSGQTAEESKFIDDEKDRLAIERGIEVIRINCDYSNLEWIKQNIVDSKFSELFNLSSINWTKCAEFALSNLVKIACNYKRNNPNLTTVDISKIMKINYVTVCNFLKKGTKFNWCEYTPKKERKRNAIYAQKLSRKRVEIFQNGVSMGVFESVSELERQSEKLFGIKLLSSCISMVCNGKRKIHRGFTFKYIKE